MAENLVESSEHLTVKDDLTSLPCSEECSSEAQSDNSSLSSYNIKLLEANSSSIDSEQSSCSSTRRNSLQSSSDYELHLLFGSSGTSTRSDGTPLQPPSSASDILGGIDLLLHRLTSERFLELRRIQLGQRPVTGTNARENLETFFHRAVHGLTNEEQVQQDEENRPEHVTNDVTSLLQQGIVRAALQNDFRQHLERSLASRVVSASQEPQQRSMRRAQSASTPNQNQRPSFSSNPFRAHLERMLTDRLNANANIRNSSVRTNHRQAPLQRRNTIATNSNTSSASSHAQSNVTAATHGGVPNNSSRTQSTRGANNLQITIESGMQLLTESITEDLTRLRSLQVVSNMLNSDFRNDLEDRIHERVSTVGNGENVQNFIRSLPSRARESGTQARYRRAPFVDSSEIENLQRQLSEMKRMMAMSIEIQMDTQRTIRQEVAAVFASFMDQYAQTHQDTTLPRHPTVLYPNRNTPPAASGHCVICVDRSIDTVLYQCGHMCVCNQCGLQLKMDGHHCPMCRAPIRDVIRAYQVQ